MEDHISAALLLSLNPNPRTVCASSFHPPYLRGIYSILQKNVAADLQFSFLEEHHCSTDVLLYLRPTHHSQVHPYLSMDTIPEYNFTTIDL
jgi:hypothetical protein